MNPIEFILTHLSVNAHNTLGRELILRIIGLSKEVYGCIDEIEKVSCGEEQLEADGDYDDSGGMKWIYDRIQKMQREY